MTNKILGAGLIVITLLCSGVEAAQIWCSGKITSAYIDNSGYLVVYGPWRGDYTVLCNIKSAWKGIDSMTCLSWMGIALTATSKQQTVYVSYNDPAALACNTLATYGNSPPPVYVMLRYP